MKRVLLTALGLICAAGLVAAELQPAPRGPVAIDAAFAPVRDDYDCTMGNNPWFETGWAGGGIYWYPGWWGINDDWPQEYVHIISRIHADCGLGCSEGWALRWAGMFKAMDELTFYDAQVVVYTAALSGTAYVPDVLLYESPVITIEAGSVDYWSAWIIFKEFGDAAFCRVPASGRYFAGVRLLTNPEAAYGGGDPLAGLVTDRSNVTPGAGPRSTSYLHYPGIGWIDAMDLHDAGLRGNFAIWATVDCCWEGIPTEGQSWSSIKKLFQ